MILKNILSKRPDPARVHEIIKYIGNNPDRFAALIEVVLENDDTSSKYASWMISHCMKGQPSIILPHVADLIQNLGKPGRNDSVLRSTVKALSIIEIPEPLQGHALQHCFDLLLNPKIIVSIQVHAMQTAFNISQNEPDLLKELQLVIEDNLENGSAGYQSRGRSILRQIAKILNNKPGSE